MDLWQCKQILSNFGLWNFEKPHGVCWLKNGKKFDIEFKQNLGKTKIHASKISQSWQYQNKDFEKREFKATKIWRYEGNHLHIYRIFLLTQKEGGA